MGAVLSALCDLSANTTSELKINYIYNLIICLLYLPPLSYLAPGPWKPHQGVADGRAAVSFLAFVP